MRTRLLLLPVVLFSGLAVLAAAAIPTCSNSPEKNVTAPAPRPKIQKRVFTNEDLERPGGQLITTEGPPTEAAAPSAEPRAAAFAGTAFAKLEPYVKERDPEWYRGQLGSLRAEVARVDTQIHRLRDFRATGRGMMGGLVLGEPSLRLTPENEIEQLGVRRQELQQQIDELEGNARRNGIAPGFLIAASPYMPALSAQTRPRLTPAEADELEEQRTEIEVQLAEEKAHLKVAQKQLDLIERDDVLFRQQFYSNPEYASDDKGKAQLTRLASRLTAKQDELSAAQEKIEAFQKELETLDRGLGPKPAAPLTPEQQREAWQEHLRPLREELARVQAELARMRADTAARGLTLYPETSTGSPTSILLRQLETRTTTLRQQIEAIDDEAHRTGALPGWLR